MNNASILAESRKVVAGIINVLKSRQQQKSLLDTPLYANAIYNMLANITSALFGFIFWIISARFFSAQDVGLGSAVISSASLLALFSTLGLGWGLLRFLSLSREPNKLINTAFSIASMAALFVAIIFMLGLGLWSPALGYVRENPAYLAVFIIFVPIATLTSIADASFMAKRQARFLLARSMIFNILRVILPVIIAIYFGSFGVFGSWSLALTIALVTAVFWFLPRISSGYRLIPIFDRQVIKEIIPYSFTNYLTDFFSAAPGFLLPLLVINRLGAEQNAFFYMGWTISCILTMIPVATATSLMAEGSYDETKLRQHTWRGLKMTLLILIPAVILVILLADKILMVYGKEYAQQGTTLLQLLALSALPIAINNFFFNVKRIQKQLKPVIFFTALICILTLVTSYLLLPSMGINGVGIACLASQSISAAILTLGVARSRFHTLFRA